MRTPTFATVFLAIVCCSAAFAGPLKIGDSAPAWTNLPGVDGKSHSLADLKDAKAVLVVFFDNHCPECDTYKERIKKIASDYEGKGVATVLISVSRHEDDTLEKMKPFAAKEKLPKIYLRDDSQKIGKQFGATKTPEVFLLDQARKLAYHGAIDDHWKESSIKRRHLQVALDQLLAGKAIEVPTTKPEGCDIEYD